MFRVSLKTLVPALAVAATLFAAADAASAATLFDLRGQGGAQTSYQFTEGGVTLTTTAQAWDDEDDRLVGAQVHQSSYGLGVRHNENDGSNQIDSYGYYDVLWLSFSEPVQVETLYFLGVDWSFTDLEGVRFVNESGDTLGEIPLWGGFLTGGYAELDLSYLPFDLPTQGFGITLAEACEDVRLKKVKVTTGTVVPLPAAVWPGLALMGAVALRRKRKQPACA